MTTPRIRPLAPDLVSKIAAGEVVERPASVVKELLENSLDAGATMIEVDLLEGGRELIRIVDNGGGIAKEDLPLAVTSHATSKLQDADDLFRISTMGFRGEALASIAGVSDLALISRPRTADSGARIDVSHGHLGAVKDAGCPVGTTIEVRNLFASVPVRRKFLKSKQTELGHISEAAIRLCLGHPHIGLTLRHHDRVLLQRNPGLPPKDSIELLLGAEVSQSLIPVSGELEGARVSGFVCDPSASRPTNRWVYLFVNGRFIRDRSLSHAVQESYRGLILSGRFPVAFLQIELPADQVDVNVHPTKIEVRFEEPRRLYSLLLSTIRERFLQADLAARWKGAPRSSSADVAVETRRESLNQEFSLRSSIPAERQPGLWSAAPSAAPTTAVAAQVFRPLPPPAFSSPAESIEAIVHPEVTREVSVITEESSPPASLPLNAAKNGPTATVRAIQVHNSYLVVETDEGMLLVDQHALHERILYQELRDRLASQQLEIQTLLIPEPIDVTSMQAAMLMECREVLESLGVGIEPFGDRSVLVRHLPAMLRRMKPADLVCCILDKLEETGESPTRQDILDDLLHMVACKAAVKAGDPLTLPEIKTLLERREMVEDSHHCPHGRPTVLRFTLGDLERQFQRK